MARARVGEDRLWSLGKLNPRDHEYCHVLWGGKEHVVREYEVLVSTPALHQDKEEEDLAEAIRRSFLVSSTPDTSTSIAPPAPSLAPDCPVCLGPWCLLREFTSVGMDAWSVQTAGEINHTTMSTNTLARPRLASCDQCREPVTGLLG